jgi:hypothetical protein
LFREANYLNLSSVNSAAISGAVAGCIAGFISCPLDVLKTRLMTQNFKLSKATTMTSQIYS